MSIDEFDSEVISGTDSERMEYIGGKLWDICFELYLKELSQKINDASIEYEKQTGSQFDFEDVKNKLPSDCTVQENIARDMLNAMDCISNTEIEISDNETAIICIQAEQYERYLQLCSTIGNDFLRLMHDCGIYANDLVVLSLENEDAIKTLLETYYNEFVDGVNRYGMNYAKLAVKYGEQLMELSNIYGNSFIKTLSTYAQYGDDIIKLTNQRDEYFVECLINKGADGESAVVRLIQNTSKTGLYNRYSLNESNSINNRIEHMLEKYSNTLNDFNMLRLKNVAEYTPSEIEFMKAFRESIPYPTSSTLMSKVIPITTVEKYISGNFTTISGFVTKADDVVMCENYMDYYNYLRLDYKPANYFPATDEALAVIRFHTNETNKITVPYIHMDGWNGLCNEKPPFVGNGYSGAIGMVIPEYWCYDNASDSKQYCTISDGAELYIITQDGEEILWAIYKDNAERPNGEKGMFVRLEDLK